jgi:hypothetical protein
VSKTTWMVVIVEGGILYGEYDSEEEAHKEAADSKHLDASVYKWTREDK